MRVQVRKCPFTGKIFEEKDLKKYVAHLKQVREDLRLTRAETRAKKTFRAWLKKEKLKITNVDQIGPWFIENQKTIMTAANALLFPVADKFKRDDRFVPSDKFTKVALSTSGYSTVLSNSHSCPEGGVTNWCGKDPNAPKWYPGWRGYISVSLFRTGRRNSSYPTSDILDLVGIRTGSGGGGNESSSWDIKIFLADWPGLKEQVREMEESEIVRKLKGVR